MVLITDPGQHPFQKERGYRGQGPAKSCHCSWLSKADLEVRSLSSRSVCIDRNSQGCLLQLSSPGFYPSRVPRTVIVEFGQAGTTRASLSSLNLCHPLSTNRQKLLLLIIPVILARGMLNYWFSAGRRQLPATHG